mmetsp:Transcript_97952/g.153175  ORF Transcript_97952/g.153175 Transcript_97952/m.153175 type:complete len:1502 (-) Transcript_97952:162-4667(-)
MLALDEKPRTVVLLSSGLSDERGEEIFSKFQACYLDVKARKQLFMTGPDSDACFHYLPKAERPFGLMYVLVLETLNGTAVADTLKLKEALEADPDFPKGFYCSPGSWEAARDLEYFFPHLDSLPVERTLALIKPDGLQKGAIGNQTLEEMVEATVVKAGLLITGKRKVALQMPEAQELCKSLEGTADYEGAVGVLRAEPGCVAMCLEGPGAVGKWNLLCGPRNSDIARKNAPSTLRAMWGTDGTSNALHASETMDAADLELAMLFPEGTLSIQRTLCIVKPDAMPYLLQIRQAIEERGFTVLAEKQIVLTDSRARDFYRDLQDKPFFNALVTHACSGPCCIFVLCRLEAVSVWQQLMGPEIVKDAKRRQPASLRARFGKDGQRNAVHGSESLKTAAREVRFFFPELGADPMPNDEEIRDYLFRKSAIASMDLKTLSDADNINNVDATLQQLLSKGLLALAQKQEKGLRAVKFLSRWLMENNPNKTAESYDFQPADRTKRVVEYGVNQDGLAFSVEAPAAPKKKQVVEYDPALEPEEQRTADLATPPFVVFVLGGPGAGKGTQCAKIREDFNLVHLSTGDLMRQEVAAKTSLGAEIYNHLQQGSLVPDSVTLKLLKKTMVKHQDTNRFLLDGFPRSVEQAQRFEQEIAEFAFGVYFEVPAEAMRKRIAGRAAKNPGAEVRVDDNPETVEKRIKVFEEQTVPVVQYYSPIGKIRNVNGLKVGEDGMNAEKDVEEVYAEAKRFFSCRISYLLAPPGAPSREISERMESKYGYSSIDFLALLRTYAASGAKDSEKVAAALKKGKPVDASIACPLVLAEIYRDMALGAQNFVIRDFPQSPAQSEFLEYRIPSNTNTLLLDFARADAEDLAACAPDAGDVLEDEMKVKCLFGDEMKAMFKSLGSRLVSIPCQLAGLEVRQDLIEATWKNVCDKIMPGLTIVLGPPCSGIDMLANQLAGLTPNTYVVDCDRLLDSELERRTEIGLTLHNMLARGQVVPFSMTLELLKNIVNLTCSDNLVLLNCPMYVDQIEYITNEFRIDRVFYINGNTNAISGWREAFVQQGGGEESSGQRTKLFNECLERLEPIVVRFSRMGKLDQLDVNETPKQEWLATKIRQATMPQFAIINGVSETVTKKQADMLASSFGVGPGLTTDVIEKWAKEKLKRTVDPTKPEEFFSALQQYADSTGFPMLVLARYPNTDKDAADFVRHFGNPAVMVSIDLDEEAHKEEYIAEHENDDTDPEELDKKLEDMRKQHNKVTEEFKNKCAPSVMSVNWTEKLAALGPEPSPEVLNLQLNEEIRSRLLPKVYVLVAPSGKLDFSSLVANAVCTERKDGGRPPKFSIVDADAIFRPGGHSAAIEEKLVKAAFTSEAPDTVSASLWKELFIEALKKSSSPMGPFIVTNFPTPCSLTSSPTVRDQFSMLESVSTFMGIFHVKVGEAAYQCCVDQATNYAAYADSQGEVQKKTIEQFGAERMKECIIDQCSSAYEAAKIAAADFLAFYEKAEQTRR